MEDPKTNSILDEANRLFLAGKLRDRIGILLEIKTPNEFGEKKLSYQFDHYVRSKVNFVNGDEANYNGPQGEKITNKFKVYWRAGKYNTRMVIEYRGDYYNIKSIDPDQDRTYMILSATKIMDNTVNIVNTISIIYADTIIHDHDKLTV